jgi:hypothetical protein
MTLSIMTFTKMTQIKIMLSVVIFLIILNVVILIVMATFQALNGSTYLW